MKCETIKVAHGDGFMVINKSDFDPKVHTEYGKQPEKKSKPKLTKKKLSAFGNRE